MTEKQSDDEQQQKKKGEMEKMYAGKLKKSRLTDKVQRRDTSAPPYLQ